MLIDLDLESATMKIDKRYLMKTAAYNLRLLMGALIGAVKHRQAAVQLSFLAAIHTPVTRSISPPAT